MMRVSRWMPLLAGAVLAQPLGAQSLEALRSAPLEISADQADIARSGEMRYSGNVVFDSATLEARGEDLRLSRDANGQISVRLTGNPAELQHRPDNEGAQPMDAQAERIDFQRATGVIDMRGAVVMQRAGDRISGEQLRYDLVEQRINAEGGESGGRVRITIDPETIEEVAP